MDTACSRLTILFEDPFWVGYFEREAGGKLEACKVTFGAEPRDQEVWAFVLRVWRELTFSPAVAAGKTVRDGNPKRAQRLAAAHVEKGVGTKAQQAIQLQREQNKQKRREEHRQKDEAEEERKFQLRQEKKREKHRGH